MLKNHTTFGVILAFPIFTFNYPIINNTYSKQASTCVSDAN